MVMPMESWADDDARSPIIVRIVRPPIWAVVIWVWGIGIVARWRITSDGRRLSRFLIHVQVNSLRDMIRVGPSATGVIGANLSKLVGRKRKSLDHILIRTKVVKSSVTITEYFEMDGCVADVFAVGFDSGARFGGLDQHVVSDRPVRATFDPGRNSLAAGKQADKSRAAGKEQVFRSHIC